MTANQAYQKKVQSIIRRKSIEKQKREKIKKMSYAQRQRLFFGY